MANPKDMTGSGDKAKRINSLNRSIDKLVQEQNRKRMNISNEAGSLTRNQQQLTGQVERTELTVDAAKGYNDVLKGLSRTINSLATGVKTITVETGKATSDAISQYGKAVSEDININKTNTVAMALSKSTPIFGYFAAKFMETDVFQNAASRIKDRVGLAMSEGLSKAGTGVANMFKRGREIEENSRSKTRLSDLESLQRSISEGGPPKLQKGGYVKEGGIVEVHAAEVVTPIDKLLKQIDEAKSADISKRLNKTLTALSENISVLETVVVDREQKQQSIITTFIEEYKKARNRNETDFQKRLLKGILELKVAIVGSSSRLRIAWQRTLLQHPLFRNMLMFSDIVQTAIMSPIKFLFGIRGGYAGDVRRATATSNAFMRISNLLSLLYSRLLPKIDNISLYSKVAAEAMVGEEIKGPKQYTYTMFGKIRELLTTRRFGQNEGLFGKLIESLNLDRNAMKEAGITSLKDFLNPLAIMRKMGVSKSNVAGSVFEGYGRSTKDHPIFKLWKNISDKISSLVNMKAAQEEREGPHSPSMAQNIATTTKEAILNNEYFQKANEKIKGIFEKASEAKKSAKKRFNWFSKKISNITSSIKKFGKEARKRFNKRYKQEYEKQKHLAEIRKEGKRGNIIQRSNNWILNKDRKDRKGWTGIIIGLFSTLVRTTFGVFSKLTSMSAFLLGPFFKMFKFILGPAGKLFKGFGKGGLSGALLKPFGQIGKYVGGFRGAAAGGGIRGVAGYMARGGLRLAGATAGLVTGAAIGGGMGIWDAIQAIRDPEGFMGNFLIRGLAGFIGGTDTGFAGAKWGAMKGGAMGAAIGSIVPGVGTLIGGAVGAAAGGILGFVGGKKISEGLSKSLSTIGDLAKGLWKIAIFPFKAFKEGMKSVWVLAKFGYKQVKERFKEWLAKPGWLSGIVKKIGDFMSWLLTPFRYINNKLKEWTGLDIWKSFKDTFGKTLKNMLYNLMFPLVGLRKAYTWVKDKFVEKISSLPIIGKIFKTLVGAVKDINEGTLASKLESSLNEMDKPQSLKPTVIPSNRLSRLNKIEGEFYKAVTPKMLDFFHPMTAKEIAAHDAARTRSEIESRRAGFALLGKQMGETYTNGQNKTTAAIIQNTNVMAASHNYSNTNNNTSGGGNASVFGSGAGFASDVVSCNIH